MIVLLVPNNLIKPLNNLMQFFRRGLADLLSKPFYPMQDFWVGFSLLLPTSKLTHKNLEFRQIFCYSASHSIMAISLDAVYITV